MGLDCPLQPACPERIPMRKTALALALLITVSASAQDCGLRTEKDPFTQGMKVTTGFLPFGMGMNRFRLSVEGGPAEIDFFFKMQGPEVCFDTESKVELTFEGGRLKSTFTNTGTLNCEGMFHFTFRNSATTTPSLLTRLGTKKVISIKFLSGSLSGKVFSLRPEEQQLLMDQVACLTREAKSLVRK